MKRNSRKKIRLVGMLLLIGYTFLLIYFLFFAEWFGRDPVVQKELRYNLVPFLEIKRYIDYWEVIGLGQVIVNLMGNIIGFLPLGYLLPTVWVSLQRFWIVVYLGLSVSIIIECFQLMFGVGSCDIDDVILNTLGVGIGYLIYAINRSARRKKNGKKTKV